MANAVKIICQSIHKSKLVEICEQMQACEWEREIMLELYAEPRIKTIESLVYSNKDNFYKRLPQLETRLISFMSEKGFSMLGTKYLENMFIYFLKSQEEKQKKKK